MAFESLKEKSERVPQWLRDFITMNRGFSGEVLLQEQDTMRERVAEWQKEQAARKRTNAVYVEKSNEVPAWVMRVLAGLVEGATNSDEKKLLWKRLEAWTQEQDSLSAVPGVDAYLKKKKKK
ncbi:MAG: hypothetical protein Q7R73_05100 [bacterium]|nr:hypothetical protein [bacterium]